MAAARDLKRRCVGEYYPRGEETVLRTFALVASACVIFFATLARAQEQVDIAVSGATLLSPAPNNDIANFQQPPEKAGIYPGVSVDILGYKQHRHLGLNFETSWRYHKANYPFNGETYRPIFSDVNLLFQPKLKYRGGRFGLDLQAGIGIASTRFFLPNSAFCSDSASGCINYTSSNHFMEDMGLGIRYYVWHRLPHIFVRPEIRYYHIQNNLEFSSDNVFKVGASLGYTFGRK